MGTMFKTVLKLLLGFTLAKAAQKQISSQRQWKYRQQNSIQRDIVTKKRTRCNPEKQDEKIKN